MMTTAITFSSVSLHMPDPIPPVWPDTHDQANGTARAHLQLALGNGRIEAEEELGIAGEWLQFAANFGRTS